MGSQENIIWDEESGEVKVLGKEHHHRTAQTLSASLLRKKSDPELVNKVRFRVLKNFVANLQEVIFGTKLFVLLPAIPAAIVAESYSIGRVSVK